MRLLTFLVRRSELIAWALILSAVTYAVHSGHPFPYRLVALGSSVLIGVALPQVAWRTILRFHEAAMEREDIEALQRIARVIGDSYPGHATLFELSALMIDERYDEVRALCAAALARPTSRTTRAMLRRALASATALGGDPAAAIPIAQSAIEDASSMPELHLAACHETLGMALVLSGRPADGLVELERAFASGGMRRAQAIRSFYMGEALRALSRVAEASAAYARCIELRPSDRWRRRAQAARAKLAAGYR